MYEFTDREDCSRYICCDGEPNMLVTCSKVVAPEGAKRGLHFLSRYLTGSIDNGHRFT